MLSHTLQALAVETAEAAAERVHRKILDSGNLLNDLFTISSGTLWRSNGGPVIHHSGPFPFFPPAHLFYDKKIITRGCWMGTGVSNQGFARGVEAAYESMDALPLVFCYIADFH